MTKRSIFAYLVFWQNKATDGEVRSSSLKWFVWLKRKMFEMLSVLIVLILIKILLFDIYQVKSISMQDTLLSGDLIFVNKAKYGARMPQKPKDIPLVEAIAYCVGFYSWAQEEKWDYYRMPGVSEIHVNDIVVFNDPNGNENNLVKRCVGLPGDTICIRENRTYLNGAEIEDLKHVKFSFLVLLKRSLSEADTLRSFGLSKRDILLLENDTTVHFLMSRSYANALLQCPLVKSISMSVFDEDRRRSDVLFPANTDFSIENYGPIVVPAKGMTIALDSAGINIYGSVITRFENAAIAVARDARIHDLTANTYTFKNNYFFLIGDNRYQSWDSRHWGFVPERAIIGKASFVLLSINEVDPGDIGLRWNRIFNDLN